MAFIWNISTYLEGPAFFYSRVYIEIDNIRLKYKVGYITNNLPTRNNSRQLLYNKTIIVFLEMCFILHVSSINTTSKN